MEHLPDDVLHQNLNAFDVFFEKKITMREGLIRVLEQKVDPLKLAKIDDHD